MDEGKVEIQEDWIEIELNRVKSEMDSWPSWMRDLAGREMMRLTFSEEFEIQEKSA